jgi:hypothetical protein
MIRFESGLLTDMKNNDTQGIWGFIQVRVFMRIITLRLVCVSYIMIHWIGPPLPFFYRLKGYGLQGMFESIMLDRSPPRTGQTESGSPSPTPWSGASHAWLGSGPRRQRLYKWAREPRFERESNPKLSLVPISGGARQRREVPLLPPPELSATAGSGAMELSSSWSKNQGMN